MQPKLEPLDSQPEPLNIRNSDFNLNPSTLLAESNDTLAVPRSDDDDTAGYEFTGKEIVNYIEENNDYETSDPDALAIVPVPDENHLSTVECPSRRKRQQRSSELVRVSNLEIEEEMFFHQLVRKTRMLYDSLCIYITLEEDKRRSNATNENIRTTRSGYLKAASLMNDKNLWLNQDKRIVGPIPGINVGDVFLFRMELCVLGIHGQTQAGIDFLSSSLSSNGEPIAISVIVSGGYEDDEDKGDVIIYTGKGGQDKHSKQVAHQKLVGGNLGMERSMHYGIEIRVIRKYKRCAKEKIYVYDGIYKIEECLFDIGISGFGVFKFKLVRIGGQPEMGSSVLKFAEKIRDDPVGARPVGYVSLDISKQKESVPVLLFNDIDDNNEPLNYEYLVKTAFPPFVYDHAGNCGGCECIDGCISNCECAKKNGGEFAYDSNGLPVRGKPLIYECGPFCSCPPGCWNRVSQKGVKNRFEVFRSTETGWGVRSLDLIQAGSFICEYTGTVLTKDQAQVFTKNEEGGLVYPNRFGEKWAEWGDLSHVFGDYVRPSYPILPPIEFAMDVSRMRNVACYMSHSSCPNVFVQFVMFDHSNIMFPHLMLFAMEAIPPLRELSLDYEAVGGKWTETLSICN